MDRQLPPFGRQLDDDHRRDGVYTLHTPPRRGGAYAIDLARVLGRRGADPRTQFVSRIGPPRLGGQPMQVPFALSVHCTMGFETTTEQKSRTESGRKTSVKRLDIHAHAYYPTNCNCMIIQLGGLFLDLYRASCTAGSASDFTVAAFRVN